MPEGFIIVTRNPGEPNWKVVLTGCDRAHAETVLYDLEREPTVPSNLELIETDDIYGDGPHLPPVAVPWWKRLIRRG